MLLVRYFAAALLAGACLYALYICGRILFLNDVRHIKDEDGSLLEMPQIGKHKFAGLYGFFGASGIALLLFELFGRLPSSRWEIIFGGFATAFSGTRWFVIRSHKKQITQLE